MRLPLLASLLALSAVTGASPQAPPSLTGHWVFAGDRSTPPAPNRANFGLEFDAHHDAAALTLERTSGTQKVTTVYPLDGTEKEARSAQAVTKTRARWENGAIVMDVTNEPATTAAGTTPPTTISKRRIWIEGDTLLSEWAISSPIQSTTLSVYKHPPAPGPANPPAKAAIAAMSWLVGTWEATTPTSYADERWTPAAAGTMMGVSRTVSGTRLAAFEFLRLTERDGTLVYLAQPNGRAPATEFTLTRIGAAEAVFENPAHDFPKMITYTLSGNGTLTAVISDTGGLKPQSFVFKKSGG